jgi:TrmH family RNA methyltransferase
LVEIETQFPLVVCPELGDASNLGAIIRTAAALGAGMIAVAHGRGADPYSPKAVRAASGALFRIPVVASPALFDDVAELAARGALVIGAAVAVILTVTRINPAITILGGGVAGYFLLGS